MADFTPSVRSTSTENGTLQHTIIVDALTKSRARQKASRLGQAKGLVNSQVVTINDSGEQAPPGFTKYEVIVTSST